MAFRFARHGALAVDELLVFRYRGVKVVGSLGRFLIVFHALQLLCVRSVDVITSIKWPSSSLYGCVLCAAKWIASILFLVCFIETRPIDQGCTALCVILVYAF